LERSSARRSRSGKAIINRLKPRPFWWLTDGQQVMLAPLAWSMSG
jgi:hypothetical protein